MGASRRSAHRARDTESLGQRNPIPDMQTLSAVCAISFVLLTLTFHEGNFRRSWDHYYGQRVTTKFTAIKFSREETLPFSRKREELYLTCGSSREQMMVVAGC